MIITLLLYALLCILALVFIKQDKNKLLEKITWVLSAVGMYLIYVLIDRFDETLGIFQMQISIPWIATSGINLSFAIDGYSLWIIILTILITTLCSLLTNIWTTKSIKTQLLIIYILQLLLILCFSALDAMMFLFACESMLLPIYVAITLSGEDERQLASSVFLIYMLSSAILMTIPFVILGNHIHSFAWQDWVNAPISLELQYYYFITVFLGTCIKLPLFPFHSWLPLVYTQAPVPIMIIILSLFLNVASFTLLRWVLPIVPDAASYFANIIVAWSLCSLILAAFIALAQRDLKRLLSYLASNSVSWIMLGLFAGYLSPISQKSLLLLDGAIMQMISHALISAGLCMVFGMLYFRTNKRDRHLYSGLSNSMPYLSSGFMILSLANIATPGSSAFISQWMILLGITEVQPLYNIIISLAIITVTAATLSMYLSIFSGPIKGHKWNDINSLEIFVLILLITIIFAIGLFPRMITNSIHNTSFLMKPYIFCSKIR